MYDDALTQGLHGHRYGKTPEKKEYHLAHNLKKRCIKKNFKGIHNRFLRDPDFRKAMLEHDRDEERLYQMGRSCRTRYHSLHDGIRIFSIQTKLVDLSTPRIWITTTQTAHLLEVPGTAPIIEFFLQLVAMEWILVIFLSIQRKSMKEDACKDL